MRMTAGVTAAFCILLRSFYRKAKFFYLPVYADCHQVEYGRGGADDVHGDVGVAPNERQSPQTVNLKNELIWYFENHTTYKEKRILVFNLLTCTSRD